MTYNSVGRRDVCEIVTTSNYPFSSASYLLIKTTLTREDVVVIGRRNKCILPENVCHNLDTKIAMLPNFLSI